MPNRTWVKAARIGLVAGLIAIVSAVVAIVQQPGKNDSPTCDGRPMLKTDLCIEHFSDGSTARRDYDQMKGRFNPAAAGLFLGGGVLLAAGSVWVWRRNREQPSAFAPDHFAEVEDAGRTPEPSQTTEADRTAEADQTTEADQSAAAELTAEADQTGKTSQSTKTATALEVPRTH
ncbi:hypothetical protein GCM10009839_34300 [Catenulispora yoronensis]|uniref:Uncharacterized protein n=1 Tax=Catenulispora yoronensis TaxID=450799 RepID=A0ABN2U8W2_9ACTN